jgi:Sulfotransferase family
VKQPILVTGAHRSGTTWVGAMLALSPEVGLIHEPFSPDTSAGVSGGPFERAFQYVCAENEDEYVERVERTLRFSYDFRRQLPTIRSLRVLRRTGIDVWKFCANRARRSRPLVKDPIAVFSSEWFASRFDAQVVVLVRHPAAFASSLVRLRYSHDFKSFLAQPLLLRDHLGRFEAEIRDFAARERDCFEQAILLWRLIYSTVDTFRARQPEWTVVRHEDLAGDPASGFESLYASLGLELSDRIRRLIAEHSAEENPAELAGWHDVRLNSRASVGSWKTRLSPEQIERVREGTRDVWPAFYAGDDW